MASVTAIKPVWSAFSAKAVASVVGTAAGCGSAADAARADAGDRYDSSERREAFAKSLARHATPEQIAVRMRATSTRQGLRERRLSAAAVPAEATAAACSPTTTLRSVPS
jgi:hypothetical protein